MGCAASLCGSAQPAQQGPPPYKVAPATGLQAQGGRVQTPPAGTHTGLEFATPHHPQPLAKRGLAHYRWYPLSTYCSLPGRCSVVSWYYNWLPTCEEHPPWPGSEFVPMLWGADHVHFAEEAKWSVPPGTKYLLTFNEPDRAEQANMSPQEAVALWPKIERLARRSEPRLLIGSPAVADNLNWLAEFLRLGAAQSPPLTVDFLALHAYRETGDAFVQTVADWHVRFPRWQLWVTEYGYGYTGDPDNSDKAMAMMQQSTQFMEDQDYVLRYSYFGACSGPAAESTGGIGSAGADICHSRRTFTPLGLWYYFAHQ